MKNRLWIVAVAGLCTASAAMAQPEAPSCQFPGPAIEPPPGVDGTCWVECYVDYLFEWIMSCPEWDCACKQEKRNDYLFCVAGCEALYPPPEQIMTVPAWTFNFVPQENN